MYTLVYIVYESVLITWCWWYLALLF